MPSTIISGVVILSLQIKVLQQSPKKESTQIRKLAEQSFDHMRRSQIAAANYSSITFICLEMIKPGNVATGTVHEKTEQLNKQLSDGKTFVVFAHRAKPSINQRQNLDAANICLKKGQSGSTGQAFISWNNCTYFLFLFIPKPCIFCHEALYLLGCVLLGGNFDVTHFNITL